MSTSLYPTALDTFNNPGAGNFLSDPNYYLDVEISKVNDATAALQSYVGVQGSALTNTIDYILRHHTHTGSDSTTALQTFTARPSSDGLALSVENSAGVSYVSASSAPTAMQALLVSTPSPNSTPLVAKGVAGQSADLVQFQISSGAVQGGVTAAGVLYSNSGFNTFRGSGGVSSLQVQNTGEVDINNAGSIKGWTGAGTGQKFNIDASTGIIQTGDAGGGTTPALQINAFQVARTAGLSLLGKDNADSNMSVFGWFVDADAQVETQPRSMSLVGMVNTTGALFPNDTFLQASFPTFTNSSSYTKAMGVSVQQGVAAPVTAGAFGIAGNLSVSGSSTLGGATTVTGALTANGGILAGSQRIQNVATGTASTDAVNVSQLNTAIPSVLDSTQVGTAPTAGTTKLHVGSATVTATGGAWTISLSSLALSQGYTALVSPGSTAIAQCDLNPGACSTTTLAGNAYTSAGAAAAGSIVINYMLLGA